jgi:hypothetical protein
VIHAIRIAAPPDILEVAPIASACRDLLPAEPTRGIDVPAVITGATIDVNGGACFG